MYRDELGVFGIGRETKKEKIMRCQWIIDHGYAIGIQCGRPAVQSWVLPEGSGFPLCAVHYGIAATTSVEGICCRKGKGISRHGKWKSRHKKPICRICGEEIKTNPI